MGYLYVAVLQKIPAGPRVNVQLLDDTGSSLLDLHRRSNSSGHSAWLCWIGGSSLVVNFECCWMPIMSHNQIRCSGMFLRKALFTATAPDGAGDLFVAMKKNGIVRQLPVV